jgi:hypothetical protein
LSYVPEGIQTIEENYYSKLTFPCTCLYEQVFSAFRLKRGAGLDRNIIDTHFRNSPLPMHNLIGKSTSSVS